MDAWMIKVIPDLVREECVEEVIEENKRIQDKYEEVRPEQIRKYNGSSIKDFRALYEGIT